MEKRQVQRMRATASLMVAAAMLGAFSTPSEARKFHLFPSHAARRVPAAGTASIRPQPVHYQWSVGQAPKAHADLVAEFGKVGLNPGQYVWASSIPTGETRVVIDRLTQMAYVYRGSKLVGAAHVSTAKQGHITPLGQWSVLEKRPFYRSKKYDNAPMPWMERIDNYGIALHGGGIHGYPESHGCIHLPIKFARKLYGLTKIGTPVVIEG
jgi:lipoprotein-anchoring transpeptidase ErfK/SrfK